MSSSSDSSEHTEVRRQNGVHWPTGGRHQKFLLLHVPGLTDKLLSTALSYISNHCYIAVNKRGGKKFLHLPGVKRAKGAIKSGRQIAMEHLLKRGVEEGATVESNLDNFRFQNAPSDEDKLRKNAAIKKILTNATQVIQQHCSDYQLAKVGVLYSKAKGEPQGAHYDDYRSAGEVEEEGETISVILPLMENTALDLFNKDGRRNRVVVPPTMMIMFEGNVLHGGANYSEPNARLHLYFLKQGGVLDNKVGVGELCPLVGCPSRERDEVMTEPQVRYHWDHFHRLDEGKSLYQYRAYLEGRLMKCRYCGGYRIGLRMLHRHLKECPERKFWRRWTPDAGGGVKEQDEKSKDDERTNTQKRKKYRNKRKRQCHNKAEEDSSDEEKGQHGNERRMDVGRRYNLRSKQT